MALRVEHDLHRRRHSRNMGVLIALLAFVVLIVALTMVKISEGRGDSLKGFNHRMQDLPPPVPAEAAPTASTAAPATTLPAAPQVQQ